ncbi:MAG: sigma-70 family RNA polymerase sigma factor [Hamadaea sp.]|nr:sigma-70 family RNA polymerase sigma factor [Hamadaea sp.]
MAADPQGATAVSAPSAGRRRAERLAACLERARGGDRGALEEIVRELNPLLWHVARSQGLDAAEAADVVQTAWLELLRRMHEIRSPQALTAWLISTTKREAWHTGRKQRRVSAEEDLTGVPDGGEDLTEQVIADERARVLWRHFRALPERCQELLRIVALVDRPDYAIVSEALGMPHGSIGPTRGRCLAKLRALLVADPVWSGR